MNKILFLLFLILLSFNVHAGFNYVIYDSFQDEGAPTTDWSSGTTMVAMSRVGYNRWTQGYFNMSNTTGYDLTDVYYCIHVDGLGNLNAARNHTLYYCNYESQANIVWNNRSLITPCNPTPTITNVSTAFVAGNLYCFDVTTEVHNDTNRVFTMQSKILPPDDADKAKIYWDTLEDGSHHPYIKYTATAAGAVTLNTYIEYPVNKTKNNTNLIVGYNATRKANCSIYINNTLNTTQNNVAANTTLEFIVSMSQDGFYSYFVNCTRSDGLTAQTPNYEYEYDATSPVITYVYPKLDNTTTLITGGNASLNISCTDTNLYWLNVSVYLPNGSILYNNDTNISNVYETFNVTTNLTNLTNLGYYNVSTQCYDGHTAKKFKADNTKADKDTKTISYEIGNDKVSITLIDSNKLEKFNTLTTTWLYDRYTFDYVFKDDMKKNTYFDFLLQTNGKPIRQATNSEYQGHFIIGLDYWVDFEGIPADITYTRINKTAIIVTTKLTDTVLKDGLSLNSFGGLNKVTELAYFEVLSAANASNVSSISCVACLNTSINCSIPLTKYAENSTYMAGYYLFCENYINSIDDINKDMAMIGTILAQILLITFLVFTGFMQIRHYRDYDMQRTSFWLAFICFGLSIIEIMLTLGIVYVNEAGGQIAPILYIQLWTVGFISFLVSMAALSRIMFGLFDITGDMEKIKEW
jgi:hypothetical protein